MRYVFVEIFEFFWLTQKTPEWPKNDPKNSKYFKVFRFLTFVFTQFFDRFRGLDCWKRSKGKYFVNQEAFLMK